HSEHFCEELLCQQHLITTRPVGALQQPAGQPRRSVVNRVASYVLLSFRQQPLGVGEYKSTQLCAATGGSLEMRCRNDPKISANLHYRGSKGPTRTMTAL